MCAFRVLSERRLLSRWPTISCFFAEVLPENRDMLAVFRDGFAAETVTGRDQVDVEFSTASWRAAMARFGR
jgi:hypothetical protein